MKKPFWLLNLILLVLLISAIVFVLISKVTIEKYKPQRNVIAQKNEKYIENNYDLIYERDLFETTITEKPEPTINPEKEKSLPKPPSKINVAPPRPQKIRIIDPLPLKITGIVYFGEYKRDIVFIQNTRTKLEKTYSVSDEIEDAQIIKIFSHKVILLRSNGQQEVLYLNNSEQEEEHALRNVTFATKINNSEYEIKIDNFIKEVPDLNELIFKFDIKNAIKDRKNIGIKLGNISAIEAANQIGLSSGDIVTKVADIELTNTDSRLEAYDKISKLKNGDSFNIEIIRNNKNIQLKYLLRSNYKKIKNNPKGFDIQKIENRKNKLKDSLKNFKSNDMENILKANKAEQWWKINTFF